VTSFASAPNVNAPPVGRTTLFLEDTMARMHIVDNDGGLIEEVDLDDFDPTEKTDAAFLLDRIREAIACEQRERGYTAEQISSMLSRTWEAIATDAGEMDPYDILDFMVATQGSYTEGQFNKTKWGMTDEDIAEAAVRQFTAAWGL
jgi:hypothetical protein